MYESFGFDIAVHHDAFANRCVQIFHITLCAHWQQTTTHRSTRVSHLNINCISGLAIVKREEFIVITLRTRYSLVCECHQNRAQEEQLLLRIETWTPKFYIFTVLHVVT